MRPFFSPRQDTSPVTVKAFYIIGNPDERFAKCRELMGANPQLKRRVICVDDALGATALQLSDGSMLADFAAIKSRAELDHTAGKNAVFDFSIQATQFRR